MVGEYKVWTRGTTLWRQEKGLSYWVDIKTKNKINTVKGRAEKRKKQKETRFLNYIILATGPSLIWSPPLIFTVSGWIPFQASFNQLFCGTGRGGGRGRGEEEEEGSRVRALRHGNTASACELLQEKGQRERCRNPHWTTIQETYIIHSIDSVWVLMFSARKIVKYFLTLSCRKIYIED